MKTVFHINRLPFAERVCDKEGVHHHIYIYIHTGMHLCFLQEMLIDIIIEFKKRFREASG